MESETRWLGAPPSVWLVAGAIIVAGAFAAIAIVASEGSPKPTLLDQIQDSEAEARARAMERAAQSDLRLALAAAKVYFTGGDSYLGFDPAAARQIEPALVWVLAEGAPDGDGVVAIAPAGVTSSTVVLNVDSASGEEFCIADDVAGGGPVRGRGAASTWAACAALPDW